MGSQRPVLYCLLAFLLLCGASLAAPPRYGYLSASVDSVIASRAQVQCYDPNTYEAPASGNKLTIRPSCGRVERDILVHDRARLRTVRERSSSSSAMPPVPAIPIPPFIPPTPGPAPAEAPSATIPDHTGTNLKTPEFVVVVGFGSPAQTSATMFDTGSDLSWIQCQPCSGHCYKQHDPVFDPAKSSSYAVVPCGTTECAAAGGECNGTTCVYGVEYGDGSSTTGVLARETLTFSSSSEFTGFIFGCGETNLGDFGEVDGLLGLGRGSLSLSSQAAPAFGGIFSYCLPSYNTTPGYLSIGATPVTGQIPVQYTAMVNKPDYPSFYFIELVSINIGGYVLPVPPSEFTKTGTLLDSGTILTYLPPPAYTALRDRFKFTMQGSKPAPPYDELDTCYDFTGQSGILIPGVSFNFSDGAVFNLNFFGIMTFPDDTKPAVGCLAFVSRPADMPFSVVGSTTQRSAEVIYDVPAQKIGFIPASC
ncbi:aspartyl protease family protein At5g10770 [Brachypodium distachyon]|uniref:Peptidase A1 domain-containing protein n=1 Tax=Brachypodium distachyon TaxID=15368 RepID=I1GYU2_BRADI|nr:aspartyl protease family protein At5g10770 [Brachypodium distachyon]KQK18503.1 hypothetical protein BRADI_1g42905v3 [Brachypodium distachyon]|eukprot:XP_010229862.1 aspartyl protease family protein At5g10770 [Brachypodium distachyon]